MSLHKKKLMIIDGNALVHRAFHALPPTLTTKKGEMVNAVYGFTTILLKALRELKPEYVAVCFDLPGPTFRDALSKDYKAQRVKAPDELYAQIPKIKDLVNAFGFPIFEQSGFEADDVIATIARAKETKSLQVVIVTGDMDTLQLVDEHTVVYTMHKGMSETMTYDVEEVKKRFDGLTPDQMVDYKGLRGDPSDNIPGVKGIGEKGAIVLLKEFGTIEGLYKKIDSPNIAERYRKLLIEQKDEALLSKKLAQMVDTVPIDFDLETAAVGKYHSEKIVSLLHEFEFRSLLTKLPKEMVTIEVAPKAQNQQGAFDFSTTGKTQAVEHRRPKALDDGAHYHLVDTQEKFEDFLTKLKAQPEFTFDTEGTGLNPFEDKLLGMSFCWKKAEAWYVLAKPDWLQKLKPIFEDSKIKKYGHNLKFDCEVMGTAGIDVVGLEMDTMIASYVINPGTRQHGLDGLVFTELGYQMQSIEELIGKGKTQVTLEQVDVQRVSDYSCEDADFTYRLIAPLRKQLEERQNSGLLEKIEMPLIPVLAEMERNGILLDTDLLNKMSKVAGADIKKVEQKIYKLAGEEFNVGSPLQLKKILFEKLAISTKGIGKTKTGISTSASELEKMRGLHPIIDLISEHRELSKLKNTYLDTLPEQIGVDGRLHCSFNQTVAATGRLSSSDPNLQNIPIRTPLGQQIRKAFVAAPGYKLLSADYSQIELRIIASLANDTPMITSFKKGEDIHTRTAANVHGVELTEVTKAMRYAAKAINFGIIYGQGSTGLAETAGISREEAREFIDRYYQVHHKIKEYLDITKELTRNEGYAETFFGRRRYLPEINSSVQMIRAGAERAAINHPVQGTAADLMKLAMIEVHKHLHEISPKSKMLLQVHDELVVEVPDDEVKKVAKFVQEKMETVYTLRAPVETHVGFGRSWGEMESL